MYTDDCVMWDAKHNAMDESTQKFRETCKASCIQHAAAHEAHQKAVVEGDEKDPVIKLLDWVLVKTREAANKSMEAFQKQFEEALVPRVPAEHLLILLSNAYNTVSQFRMTIWQMVADKCIMRHDYLMNHGLASIMQHMLEKVPSNCMRIVPPRPPEPKDNLTAFLDSLANSSATCTCGKWPGMSPINRWLKVSTSTMRTSLRMRKLKMAMVPYTKIWMNPCLLLSRGRVKPRVPPNQVP